MKLIPLPIDSLLPAVRDALRDHANVVIVAEPGAGKTTRVPLLFLGPQSDAFTLNRSCLMLQPRRIAARASAARIAEERGCRLGEEVGYQVRFENRSGPKTRLKVVTEGILTRQFQSNPTLEGVGAVILDEFHERSLHTDIAIALLRELQLGLREDLKIVVMSATLDAASVAGFLGDCPILESKGRTFGVDIRYQARSALWSDTRDLDRDVKAAVQSLLDAADDDGGHVLVFLPGLGEIRRCERALSSLARERRLAVCALHGSLSLKEQDQALNPILDGGRELRKIILATNIAETSLTIEGVSAVVDTGLARVSSCDPRFGIEKLELAKISRASAAQRAGRAGRQRPGRALRLWSKLADAQMKEFESPEILRSDLSATLLTLAEWGVSDPRAFGWFEAPPAPQLESAGALLRALGAVNPAGAITPLGRTLLKLPVSPRAGRFLVAAAESGDERLISDAATCAALLTERDIISRPEPVGGLSEESDLRSRIDLLERGGGDGFAARNVLKVRDELIGAMRKISPAPRSGHAPTALSEILLTGFPDRVTRRRGASDAKGTMVGGRGIVLDAASCVRESEFFLSLNPQEWRRDNKLEARVSLAVAVTREEIEATFPELIEEKIETRFDPVKGGVIATRAEFFMDLALTDPVPARVDPEVAASLMIEALGENPRLFFERDDAVSAWLSRVDFFKRHLPEADFPDFGQATLREILTEMSVGQGNVRDLRAGKALAFLEGRLSYRQKQTFEEAAPEGIEVPSGTFIKLLYAEDGGGASLPVRLQEIFGWIETPRLALGKVPVTLQLLGPNFRPVQITNDLKSFWARGYLEVRKELKARYPKHSWPDDPLTAKPEAKGRRHIKK